MKVYIIFIQADLRSLLRVEPYLRMSQRIIQENRTESKTPSERKKKRQIIHLVQIVNNFQHEEGKGEFILLECLYEV